MDSLLGNANKTHDIDAYYALIDMHDCALNIETNYLVVDIRANSLLTKMTRIRDLLLRGREDDTYDHILCARIIKTTMLALRTQDLIAPSDVDFFCEEFERIRALLFEFQKINLTNRGDDSERHVYIREMHEKLSGHVTNIRIICKCGLANNRIDDSA